MQEQRRGGLKWWWVCVALVGAYAWYMMSKTIDIHRGLGTSAYDFGLYEQGVWLLSRFESPFVTLMGRNLFGDHSSFILLFVVPLYWFNTPTWRAMSASPPSTRAAGVRSAGRTCPLARGTSSR